MSTSIRHRDAFTILEALIALGVGSAVILLFLAVRVTVTRAFRTATAQRDATLVAERALDLFVRELRAAQTGRDGSYPIRVAEDQELVMLSDVDSDGEAEWIRYALVNPNAEQGGTIERSIVEATGTPPRYDEGTAVTTVVARGVRNVQLPLFTYYSANYPKDTANNPLTTPNRLAGTRYIRMEIAINLDPRTTTTTTVVSGVAIRNLREGL